MRSPLFLYPADWLSAHADLLDREQAHQVEHFQGMENLLHRLQALMASDLSDSLDSINTPTLAFSCQDDLLVPCHCSTTLARNLPIGELVQMSYGGHAMSVTDSETFNPILLSGYSALPPKFILRKSLLPVEAIIASALATLFIPARCCICGQHKPVSGATYVPKPVSEPQNSIAIEPTAEKILEIPLAELAGVEKQAFRDAMSHLGSAVNIITTAGEAGRAGFTASAVCSVTDTPPTLLVRLNRSASVYPIFQQNQVLCVNTLSDSHEALSNLLAVKRPWRKDLPPLTGPQWPAAPRLSKAR